MSKGYICDVELSLHLLSSIGNHDCPGQLVYLSIEMFGTVHKTKPQHSYYPLLFNEVINFQKTFYSPSNENEVLEMLEDSSVIIELRRLDPCFYTGLLLSYFDGNAKDFLFSKYPRIPCSMNGQEIYLDRTIDFSGTAPRLRYSVFADITKVAPAMESFNPNSSYLSNNRSDDGYFSPSQSFRIEKTNYDSKARKSRSRKPSYEIGSTENLSGSKRYTRQTVSSALRSRSPSPVLNKSNDFRDDIGEKMDNSMSYEESDKPPFVVRKVPDSLITRSPSLHDPIRSSTSRRGRSKRRLSPTKNIANYNNSVDRRFRSASPTRKLDLVDSLETYTPSTVVSHLRNAYEIPHSCYRYGCIGRCHSPLIDYYANKIARISCLSPTHHHCCHSHCSHW